MYTDTIGAIMVFTGFYSNYSALNKLNPNTDNVTVYCLTVLSSAHNTQQHTTHRRNSMQLRHQVIVKKYGGITVSPKKTRKEKKKNRFCTEYPLLNSEHQ